MTRMAEFNPNTTPTGVYKPGRKRDENLQRIFDAAEEEFVQRGYRGATIQAIADRAGLPKANVHYYFKSKSNLYTSVLNNLLDLWNTQFSQITPEDDPAQALDEFIREKVQMSYSHPRVSKLFAIEVIAGAPYLGGYLQTEIRQWVHDRAGVIQSWVDRGLMECQDPVQLIFLIWSATQHYADFETQVLTIMDQVAYDDASIQQISDFLSTTILRGCGLNPP